MQITHLLNKAQADALFAETAIMIGGRDVVLTCPAADLFGADVLTWAEPCMKHEGYFALGLDWNNWSGDCYYFYKSGFDKLVSQHNNLVSQSERNNSEGGRIWRAIWDARCARLDAEDAEDERKRMEAKAKRAAARKARKEAAAQAAQEAAEQAPITCA